MTSSHRMNLFLSKNQSRFLNDIAFRQMKKFDKRVSVSLTIRAALEKFQDLTPDEQDRVIETQLRREEKGGIND